MGLGTPGAGASPGLARTAIAIRNVRRSLFRSFAVAAAMALMAGSLLAIAATLQVVQSGVTRGAGKLGADIVVGRRAAPAAADPAAPYYMDYSVVEQVSKVQVIVPQYGGRPPKQVPGVDAATAQLSLWLRDVPGAAGGALQVTGFEPDTDLTVLPWLGERLDGPLEPNHALVGRSLAYLAGRHIELAGQRFAVIGVLDRTGMEDMDLSVFVRLDAAWKLARQIGADSPDGDLRRPITRVMVRSRPEVDTQRVANFIRSTVADVDPKLSHKALGSLGTQLRLSVGNLVLIAAAIWLTALLLVGSASSMVIRERQRELGLLRAMGATRGGVFVMLAVEILTVCTAGGALGVAITLGALTAMQGPIGKLLGLAWTWPGNGRLWVLGLLCVLAAPATGLLAALGPALRAVWLEPHVAIQDAP